MQWVNPLIQILHVQLHIQLIQFKTLALNQIMVLSILHGLNLKVTANLIHSAVMVGVMLVNHGKIVQTTVNNLQWVVMRQVDYQPGLRMVIVTHQITINIVLARLVFMMVVIVVLEIVKILLMIVPLGVVPVLTVLIPIQVIGNQVAIVMTVVLQLLVVEMVVNLTGQLMVVQIVILHGTNLEFHVLS